MEFCRAMVDSLEIYLKVRQREKDFSVLCRHRLRVSISSGIECRRLRRSFLSFLWGATAVEFARHRSISDISRARADWDARVRRRDRLSLSMSNLCNFLLLREDRLKSPSANPRILPRASYPCTPHCSRYRELLSRRVLTSGFGVLCSSVQISKQKNNEANLIF